MSQELSPTLILRLFHKTFSSLPPSLQSSSKALAPSTWDFDFVNSFLSVIHISSQSIIHNFTFQITGPPTPLMQEEDLCSRGRGFPGESSG